MKGSMKGFCILLWVTEGLTLHHVLIHYGHGSRIYPTAHIHPTYIISLHPVCYRYVTHPSQNSSSYSDTSSSLHSDQILPLLRQLHLILRPCPFPFPSRPFHPWRPSCPCRLLRLDRHAEKGICWVGCRTLGVGLSLSRSAYSATAMSDEGVVVSA